MTETEWQIRIECNGAPDETQLESLTVDQAYMVIGNTETGRVEVHKPYTVPDGSDPVDVGRTVLATMTHLHQLIDAGVVVADRIVFETLDAWNAGSDLIGPADAAAIVGVGDRRLRQLRDTDPLFPRAVLDVGGVQIYARAPMLAYRDAPRTWSRPAGERRSGDADLLNRGLDLARQHGDLGSALRVRFATAAAVQGPKYVAEKAALLAHLTDEQHDRILVALDGGDLATFSEAYTRAKTLEPR